MSCEKCGKTVKTRSDDGKSVKDCPQCHGRMLYGGMRLLTDDEIKAKVKVPGSSQPTARTVPY